jgi:hypothetical protein
MPDTTSPNADWTVMVYFAADNELESAAFANLEMMKKVGSIHGKLNLLAQLDTRSSSQTFRYRLRDETTRLEEDVIPPVLPEINTGDPAELTAFIKWGRDNYPAERYLLVLWGHGNGWQQLIEPNRAAGLTTNAVIKPEKPQSGHTLGVNFQGKMRAYPCSEAAQKQASDTLCLRGTHLLADGVTTNLLAEVEDAGLLGDHNPQTLARNSKDVLKLEELKKALANAGGTIDILGMDACLMGFAEVGYAVRDSVKYLVASEDTVARDSWPYDRILRHLQTNSKMSPEELSTWIVRDYLRFYQEQGRDATLATCNLKNWGGLQEALRGLTETLCAALDDPKRRDEVRAQVVLARAYTQSFFVPNYVDLYDFCHRLSLLTTEDDIREACAAVQMALDPGDASQTTPAAQPAQQKSAGLVHTYGFTGFRVRNARGVSVYFPLVAPAENYGEVLFGQEKGTDWYRLLCKLNQEVGGLVNAAEADAAVRGVGAAGVGGVKTGEGTPDKSGAGVPEKVGGNPDKAGHGVPDKIPTAPPASVPGPPPANATPDQVTPSARKSAPGEEPTIQAY